MERIAHLFRNVPLPPSARFLGAVKARPVERFLAAAAWWPEGKVGRFQLACQPGVARADVIDLLLGGLAEAARQAGLETLQAAGLLTEADEWFGLLRSRGFECLHSERAFEVSLREGWNRVMRLYEKHRAQIPTRWQTNPIRGHSPEAVLELIAPHRLMPPAELRNLWEAKAQFGFEPDLSCVLFDGERLFGTLLLRRLRDALHIDVQVVQEPNSRLRSLGDLLMLYHLAQRVTVEGPIRRLWFRSGQAEHRQTANVALRMGGRELARAHLLARPL
jgi:hypothetical protein